MKTLFTIIVSLFYLTAFGQVVTSVTNGLVGWWLPFGTNATGTSVFDWSGNVNNGVTTDSPYWTNSVTGMTNALVFNGSTTYVKAGPATNLTDFSISMWFLNNAPTTAAIPFSSRTDGGKSGILVLNEGSIEVGFSDAAGNLTRKEWGTYIPSAWTHLAATHIAGASSLVLYVNGVAGGSSLEATAVNPGNGTNVWFGKEPTTGLPYNGLLADVRVFNRALSQNEVTLLYHEGVPWTTRQLGNPVGLYQRVAKP